MSAGRPGTAMTGESDAYAAVSHVLWCERETLEHLLYTLVAEQLVVSSGATRWLNRADADVRGALERLRASEVIRAVEVDALTLAHGLPVDATLEQLSASAPEPWSTVFADHRTALRALAFEIEAVAADNRRLLDAGAKAIRDTLDNLGLAVAGYDARGEAVSAHKGPYLLDQQA